MSNKKLKKESVTNRLTYNMSTPDYPYSIFKTYVYSWLALSRNKKIIRKPFGRQCQEIVLLWEINKEVTSPSLKSLRFF